MVMKRPVKRVFWARLPRLVDTNSSPKESTPIVWSNKMGNGSSSIDTFTLARWHRIQKRLSAYWIRTLLPSSNPWWTPGIGLERKFRLSPGHKPKRKRRPIYAYDLRRRLRDGSHAVGTGKRRY